MRDDLSDNEAGAGEGAGRGFLFLQGPHGPFFAELARMLGGTGARVWRVGFNRGDEAFWHDRSRYIAYTGAPAGWPATLPAILERTGATDLVLYGDTRPVHAGAVALARRRGLTVHVFEEGYLRPYWVTYERDGANGNSALMRTGIAEMRAALADPEAEMPVAPARWGQLRQHVTYGALYHALVIAANRRYHGFRPHRGLNATEEFRLYFNRLLRAPALWAARLRATRRIRAGGFVYHLALLQLEHDSNFQAHSPFATGAEFLARVVAGFAEGAPRHHHLVFKSHPLEDGRTDQRGAIRALAQRHGVRDRVHYVPGGKLARLLDDARTALTVNSTAAQQALWRGLPLKAFGNAVYAKPELVSGQPLAEFFRWPDRPDIAAYRDFRRYLLATSQVPGSFYSAAGRRQLLRRVVDMMLADRDPYGALRRDGAAPGQHLRAVP